MAAAHPKVACSIQARRSASSRLSFCLKSAFFIRIPRIKSRISINLADSRMTLVPQWSARSRPCSPRNYASVMPYTLYDRAPSYNAPVHSTNQREQIDVIQMVQLLLVSTGRIKRSANCKNHSIFRSIPPSLRSPLYIVEEEFHAFLFYMFNHAQAVNIVNSSVTYIRGDYNIRPEQDSRKHSGASLFSS